VVLQEYSLEENKHLLFFLLRKVSVCYEPSGDEKNIEFFHTLKGHVRLTYYTRTFIQVHFVTYVISCYTSSEVALKVKKAKLMMSKRSSANNLKSFFLLVFN